MAASNFNAKQFSRKGDVRSDETAAAKAVLTGRDKSMGGGQAGLYYRRAAPFFAAGPYLVRGMLSTSAYALLVGEQAIVESDSLEAGSRQVRRSHLRQRQCCLFESPGWQDRSAGGRSWPAADRFARGWNMPRPYCRNRRSFTLPAGPCRAA